MTPRRCGRGRNRRPGATTSPRGSACSPTSTTAIRGEAWAGSFNQRMASVSAAANSGPWSASFYGNGFKSDGYRVNNALDQRNGIGNLNYTTPDLKAFLTVTGDDQKLGFPGGRLVDPSIGLDQLATDRRGTNTPFDYGNQQGKSATAGFTKTILDGVDLIVDHIRHRAA